MEKLNEFISFFQNIQKEQVFSVIIGILIFIIFKIFSSTISYLIIKIFNMKEKGNKIKENGFYKPLKYAVIFLGAYLGILCIGLPDNIVNIITKIWKSILIALIANGLANLVTPKSGLMKKIKKSDKINVNNQVSDFIGKIIRCIIYIIAGFMIAYEFGYNLSGIITGLGLGSVVIALAAQDIAKNLCSGVVLLFDKPFIVGDFIEIDNFSGTVEDMTFRAVRIRTLENKIVTIPNSKISEGSIINYSKIEQRRYTLNLQITLETKIEKVEDITNKIKVLLQNNEYVVPNTAEVYFNKILDNGMNIYIFCYTKTGDYMEYLKIEEMLNKEIMYLLNKENIELAYDTKTIYVNS